MGVEVWRCNAYTGRCSPCTHECTLLHLASLHAKTLTLYVSAQPNPEANYPSHCVRALSPSLSSCVCVTSRDEEGSIAHPPPASPPEQPPAAGWQHPRPSLHLSHLREESIDPGACADVGARRRRVRWTATASPSGGREGGVEEGEAAAEKLPFVIHNSFWHSSESCITSSP
ncbi:hypothetical protein GUJ93_ZPchr0006g45951 [Zizania palustris]|uniref:Uncharacterized protein n=1 Tax=Zizania palustris TaxID=103762 RepID=A0A8J5VHA4_ZIZPA|nr:hypothetical protein GUJ93_ZPchr0006g45951 [Zizania palustris]